VVAQVVPLVRLHLVCNVQAVDLLQVLAVTLSQGRQLFIGLTLLAAEASVGVLGDLQLVLHALDVDVTIRNQSPLSVQFSVQLSVLAFAVVVDGTLFVDFGSKGLDKTDVGVDT